MTNSNDSPQNLKQNMGKVLNKGIDILTKSAIITAAVTLTPYASIVKAEGSTEFKLPSLPYSYDALEPFISKSTLTFHHDKHHAKYIATTNAMIKGTEYEKLIDLTSILLKSHGNNPGLFNNAAQSWNHDFYWKCMKKPNMKADSVASGKLLKAIEDSFGSYDEFKKQVYNVLYLGKNECCIE